MCSLLQGSDQDDRTGVEGILEALHRSLRRVVDRDGSIDHAGEIVEELLRCVLALIHKMS
ncbi:hypothetical protein ACQPW1_10430 [Nocardia sp. CA-128927]|uniref:hypothetical protein n=1 Tax=Nocardia sp. CA-128927 TaxID=3239975 RepID=UPI003D9831DB